MNRRTVVALLAVYAVAIGFRLWMLDSFKPAAPWVGALTLADAEMGRNVLAGRGWVANIDMIDKANRAQEGHPTMVDLQELLPVDDTKPDVLVTVGSAHSPGYSLWFALSYWLGGDYRYVYSQRMQALLDATACLLLFGIGRRVWSNTAGWFAAVWYALSPANAFLANLTVAASTDSFWFIAVTYGAVRVWDALRQGQRPWIGAAILTGATFGGSIMNSTSFALPSVLTGIAVLFGVFDRKAWKLVPYFLLAQVLVGAALVPWAMRNASLFGQFSPVRGNFWQLAYAAWGELPNPWGMGLDDKYYWNWIDENCQGCDGGQQSKAIKDFLLSSVVTSPGFTRHIANLVTFRLPKLVGVGQLRSAFEGAPPGGAFKEPLGVWVRINTMALPLVAALVVLGVAAFWFRSGARLPALLALGPSAFLICFSLVFFVELRKTVPAYGGLFVFAGIAFAEVMRVVTLRRVAAAALVIMVAMPQRSSAAVITAGQTHSAVARPDGTVVSWGGDAYGQLGDGSYGYGSSDSAQALIVENAVAVAAGSFHTVALTKEGAVWTWGDNRWGELGDGTRSSRTEPVRLPSLDHVVAVAAGGLHSLALGADGTVWAWGDNHFGQSSGEPSVIVQPVKVQGLPPMATIAAGMYHSVGIAKTGDIWAWGQNNRGQLGVPVSADQLVPVKASAVPPSTSVAAGQYHTLAITAQGGMWSWGGNTFGQLGREGTEAPAPVDGVSGITMLAAGEDHSVALDTAGQVWAWGDNMYGQVGDGTWDVRRAPVRSHIDAPVTSIASGEAYVIASKPNGALLVWGFGYDGQLGDSKMTRRVSIPQSLASVSLSPGPDFAAASFHPLSKNDGVTTAAVVRDDGNTYVVDGEAESPTAYVISSRPARVGPDAALGSLAVSGKVIDGCVTVGVQQNAQWVAYRNFQRPGVFLYEWQPPATGDYMVVIAHCLPQGRRTNHFQIMHMGWMDRPASGSAAP